MYFYGSNLGPLALGYLGPLDLHLNKVGEGAQDNATYHIFKHLSQAVPEKKFFRIFHF